MLQINVFFVLVSCAGVVVYLLWQCRAQQIYNKKSKVKITHDNAPHK